MKKKIVALMLAALTLVLSGCGNYDMLDTVYTFDRAIIKMPDGEIIDGKIDRWSDYEGDQLQITIDGITYLVHSSDVVMIAE